MPASHLWGNPGQPCFICLHEPLSVGRAIPAFRSNVQGGLFLRDCRNVLCFLQNAMGPTPMALFTRFREWCALVR